MFLDASAVIAIIAQEEEWELLAEPLANAAAIYVSPLSIWESVMGLSRARDWSFDESEELVRDLIGELGTEIVAIDDQIGREALRAAKIYGRGRHRAALNFGDCFAYACAKACAVSLLFKGDDFSETDIPSATPAPPRR